MMAGQKGKKERNESVSAVTPVALWWTGDNIEIYEIDGELVALYGWNGEQWTDCWRCTDRYTAADDERLTVRPTYRGQVESCDDEDAAAEIVNLKIV